jgi:cell division protein FtsA
MEQQEIAIGLDIGTTKIVTIVGRKNEFDKIEILGFGKAKSLGVQRGVVSNITQTIESIKHAIKDAETDSGEKITNCVVGIAGQHIRSLQHSDYILRENSQEVITQEDVDLLVQNVHKLVMLPGEEIIHVLPQEFKIDGEPNISVPIGMLGRRLEANLHIVVGQKAAIGNIFSCVKNSDLDVSTITLEPLASADAVLSEEEKEAGVCLVDIGGGTTDIAIFKDGIIRHTAVIPFGGNVITEDIKEGCSIIERQAELLKIKFGSAWPGENSDNEIVSIPGLRGREPKEISLKMLSKVIHARLVEIIDQVYVEIKNYGNDEGAKKLIAGIVLTGGGSQLKHIKQLFEYETGMDARIGYPNEHLGKGGRSELESPMYATAIGLLMKGIEENEKKSSSVITPVKPVLDPTDVPIGKADDPKKVEPDPEPEPIVEPNASFFDKWVKGFMNFLANED